MGADTPRIPFTARPAATRYRRTSTANASTAKSPRLTRPWLTAPARPHPLSPGRCQRIKNVEVSSASDDLVNSLGTDGARLG